jgi:hypothetical protein
LIRDVFNFEGRFHANSRLITIYNAAENINTFVFLDMIYSCIKVYNEYDLDEGGLKDDSLCFWELHGRNLCKKTIMSRRPGFY